LTTFAIEWIIRRMFRRLLATLVILGWVSLSGFDVVEDLDELPGRPAISQISSDGSSGLKRGGWGPLANNIVESAIRIKQIDFTLSFPARIFHFDLVLEHQRRFQLHKLYRVFLI
jgi:hypothetical protein